MSVDIDYHTYILSGLPIPYDPQLLSFRERRMVGWGGGGERERQAKRYLMTSTRLKRSRIRFPIELRKYLSNTIVKCLSTFKKKSLLFSFFSKLMGTRGTDGERNAEKMWR